MHHEIPQHTYLLLWLLIITVYTKYGDKSNERVHGIRPHGSVTKTQTLKTQTWDPEKLRPSIQYFSTPSNACMGGTSKFLSLFHIHRITKSKILHEWKWFHTQWQNIGKPKFRWHWKQRWTGCKETLCSDCYIFHNCSKRSFQSDH